jgi:hypothetical protein
VKSRAYENSSEKPLCELLTKIQGVTANLPSRVFSHAPPMPEGSPYASIAES